VGSNPTFGTNVIYTPLKQGFCLFTKIIAHKMTISQMLENDKRHQNR